MRIGIYTIAHNEAKFAQAWAETTREADAVLVADTGSTDATVAILHAHGVPVVPIRVRPWRFDDARNAALAMMRGGLTP